MGHSYCSGPIVLSEDRKPYSSAPTTKKNLQLRSPGCPHNANQLEVREYCDNGLQKDIREFLQQEQPPSEPTPILSSTNSKRKKQILDVLFKSRHRSPRPLICHSPPPSVAKDQRTTEGRMYSQIGLDDKQMYEIGNSSTYQINYCKQPLAPMTAHTRTGTMNEKPVVSIEKSADPAPQLDIVNDYGVGISTEWPSDLLEGGETKLPHEAETETRSNFPSPPNPAAKPATGPRVRDFASSTLTRSAKSQAATIARQPSPVLKVPPIAPFWTHPHVSTAHSKNTFNINGIRVSALEDPGSVPIGSQIRLQASPPKTPRRSRQKASLEMAMSPMLGGRSKTSSMLSVNESTADDVQSDAESAIVLEAQSAEFVRAQCAAGYYNGTVKPPRPGPAPTRALPSLPEGHDGSITVQRGSIDPPKGGTSLESGLGSSPKKIPPKSPARRYGYLPSSIIANRVPSTYFRKSIDSGNKQESSQTTASERPKSSTPFLPPNDLFPEDISPATLEQRQSQRTRSTKALKMRDLECIKARRSATSPAVFPDVKPTDQREDPEESVFLPSTRYSAKSFSGGYRPQGSQFSDLSPEIPQLHEKPKTMNDFSPIIVVAEQEPTLTPGSGLLDSQQATSGGISTLPSQPPNSPVFPPFTLPLHFPVPPLPSLAPTTAPPLGIAMEPSLEPPFDTLTHRISMSHADLEARLEARISALEKKNVLLEKAFLAVLNTSATYNIQTPLPSGGDRSSGYSGASSIPGSDGRVDSMLRGMQAGMRMSTASGP